MKCRDGRWAGRSIVQLDSELSAGSQLPIVFRHCNVRLSTLEYAYAYDSMHRYIVCICVDNIY